MKYLPKYYAWKEEGEMPRRGLCYSLGHNPKLNLFRPDDYHMASHWGYDGKDRNFVNNYLGEDREKVVRKFTPLRQNIVLFLAAMNNEL